MTTSKPKPIITQAVRSQPSTASYETCDSYETYRSESTAPTSIYASTQASMKDPLQPHTHFKPVYEEDLSPSTSCYPRSSVETFNSAASSGEELTRQPCHRNDDEASEIPPLGPYEHQIVDPNVCPSTPQEFGKLFPSMHRLAIRHDDFTPDGNMNLRVDMALPTRHGLTMQLFHFRMHDLAKRDFALRRYCRESGREVCNSKLQYSDDSPTQDLSEGEEEQQQQHNSAPMAAVSSALKSLHVGSHHGSTRERKFLSRTNTDGSTNTTRSSGDRSSKSQRGAKRPQSSPFHGDGGNNEDDYESESLFSSFSFDQAGKKHPQKQNPKPPLPTNTIKLEFSNYARVDVTRRGSKGSKRYDFSWWGHSYHWRRVLDRNLGSVSFHLHRGSNATPVAHIVPETRSPTQVDSDEVAGGWVPPCHMWISDPSVLEAVTDVADVIVSTGIVALVDDCIRERWQRGGGRSHRVRRISVPLTSRTLDVEYVGPRALMHQFFHRRGSDSRHGHRRMVPTY